MAELFDTENVPRFYGRLLRPLTIGKPMTASGLFHSLIAFPNTTNRIRMISSHAFARLNT